MKKLIAIVIAVLTVFSFTTVAFAENTTTLTTTVPDAEYTLNIPADQTVTFGTEKITIPVPTVSNTSGFAEGKNLQVDFTYTNFTCPDTTTIIPIEDIVYSTSSSDISDLSSFTRHTLIYKGSSQGKLENNACTIAHVSGTANDYIISSYTLRTLVAKVDSEDWGKALAGEYTATITFTAEVVSGFVMN